MSSEPCFIHSCSLSYYAPAGTRALCKKHFLEFSAWRRKKGGAAMFKKYSAMTMDERDPTVEEWGKTVTVKD
ncbi:hypothetical protein [Nitrospira sp. M1]